MDIAAVQDALKADGIDAWLLYDFRGLNPIAADVTGVGPAGRPSGDAPLVLPDSRHRRAARARARHRDATRSRTCPARPSRYAGRDQLEAGLKRLVSPASGASRWKYSPNCAIPYIARVDAGTIELVRQFGVDVVSSGDLVQRFAAVWDAAAIATHRSGVREALPREGPRVRRDRAAHARRRADDRVRHPAADGRLVSRRRARQRLGPERLGGGERRQPALPADRRGIGAIGPDELVLLDLWGKLDRPARSLPTSPGWATPARACPSATRTRSRPIAAARDAAIALVQDAAREGRELRGWQVDRAASSVLRGAGLRRPHPAPHRPQPGRDRCTATASTWTTTRRTTIAGCSPAPASRSSRASTSTISASGRKST